MGDSVVSLNAKKTEINTDCAAENLPLLFETAKEVKDPLSRFICLCAAIDRQALLYGQIKSAPPLPNDPYPPYD